MKIKISEAASMVITILKAKLVPMLHGSPAIGKSAIIKQVAQQFGLKVIDLRLSQCDPTDLLGFPSIQANKASYVPMDTFPIEGDVIPEGYNGWMLFLDEFNSAPPAVQAAAYKLVLDRMVGMHHIHKNVAIVCAGNLDTDNAIVQPMSSALQSRLVHLELGVNAKEWSDWASAQQFDHRITSYIDFRPDHIYTFSPDHTDKTYASPRTWEFVNKVMQVSEINKELLPILAGILGEGVAREFYGFCQIHSKLPKMEVILTHPNTADVPDEPSHQFAICGALAAHATHENCEAAMDYIKRLPKEFQIVCLRRLIKRNPDLMQNKALGKWVFDLSPELV